MTQATGHEQSQGGFRVGTRREGPDQGVATPAPAPARKLPPIVWTRVDRGQVLREDLVGVSGAVTAILVGVTVFIATAMGIAVVLTTVLSFLGLDFSSLY
ncbi:hypothetical protein [Actinoplanes couchii]|uniref:AI-2E family transporter n=1 Tax=Actinoplanes couchii TaxID=403638 RepID=A0ABQ3X6Q4_9ACTN|nr:hypothetical protein [Actinoplanes couchii]MDR6322012.1 hypothetical protein [Actinoplanes couchii]GID54176.1 hypothetical protein Aco03nite_025800 [Actinoplanes couchii]